jgi:hypothetical protein
MTELARLSRILIDEPPARRASLDDLRSRSHKRHVRNWSQAVSALVIVVVVAFGAVQIQRSPSTPQLPSTQLTSYYQAAVNVSNSTLTAVGLPSNVAIPTRVTPSLSTVATNGIVSYVGAEYCPYCAIQRWALLVALSKFGTFTHLDDEVFSSSSDLYPHLASWSFVGATYSSKYFRFDPTELTSSKRSRGGPGGYQRLQRMSAAQRVAFDKYNPQGSIPFVDVDNHYVTLGASSSPSVLEGLSLSEIGSDLSHPSSAVAHAIDGSANYLIAALCTMVHKAAPAVCATSVIKSASNSLARGISSSATSSTPNTSLVQPPANAPMSVWKKWSVAQHESLLRWAASYRSPNPACTVMKISVTGRKLTKPLLGVPAGVWVWGISFSGRCPPGNSGDLIRRTH